MVSDNLSNILLIAVKIKGGALIDIKCIHVQMLFNYESEKREHMLQTHKMFIIKEFNFLFQFQTFQITHCE